MIHVIRCGCFSDHVILNVFSGLFPKYEFFWAEISNSEQNGSNQTRGSTYFESYFIWTSG